MPIRDEPPPYGTLVFDCDSTLASIEGVDELAADRPELFERVRELTRRAMDGELPLERVYGERLAILRPERERVEALGARYVATALDHGPELVRALHALGKRVHVLSGGLLPAVRVLARALGVPDERVHAVDVHHAADGSWLGFDESSPLARGGGKIDVVRELAALPGAGRVAVVGDGATDLETAAVAQRFVAFGGVERRADVFRAARVSCESADLAALLPLLLDASELSRLEADPRHAVVVRAAAARG